jgi:hypothetical protein
MYLCRRTRRNSIPGKGNLPESMKRVEKSKGERRLGK